jgi:hypothetical protein
MKNIILYIYEEFIAIYGFDDRIYIKNNCEIEF